METTALLLLGLMILLRCCPSLPISRWLARLLVEAPARQLNRVRPRHWATIALGVALIGFAIWFEIDEIRMLGGAAGSMGDLVMIVSTIEWGGLAELTMATVLSSSMLARWPVFRRWGRQMSASRAARPRRTERPANDSGDGEGRRLAA